jgi:hypothetical protein
MIFRGIGLRHKALMESTRARYQDRDRHHHRNPKRQSLPDSRRFLQLIYSSRQLSDPQPAEMDGGAFAFEADETISRIAGGAAGDFFTIHPQAPLMARM